MTEIKIKADHLLLRTQLNLVIYCIETIFTVLSDFLRD